MAVQVFTRLSADRVTNLKDIVRCNSMTRVLAASTLVLAACGASDPAQSNQAESKTVTSKTYAVAGVAPGMTAPQVVAAAQRTGYRVARQDAGRDWQLELSLAKSGRRFDLSSELTGIKEHEFQRDGETITVGYVAMPKGPVAWSVRYSAALAVLEFGAAHAELTKRYGKSSFSNSVATRWAQWCSSGARTARDCLKQSFMSLEDGRYGVVIYTADEAVRERQRQVLQGSSGGKATF